MTATAANRARRTCSRKSGANWTQVAKLLASDGAAYDEFGYAVCIDGDIIVVGAGGNDDQGYASGAAYVFVEPIGGWAGTLTQDAKLLPDDGASYDAFGESVAISGDTIVVGAWGDGDNGTYSGSAYVFVRPGGGWSGTLSQSAKLLAGDGDEWDWFGWSVSIREGDDRRRGPGATTMAATTPDRPTCSSSPAAAGRERSATTPSSSPATGRRAIASAGQSPTPPTRSSPGRIWTTKTAASQAPRTCSRSRPAAGTER